MSAPPLRPRKRRRFRTGRARPRTSRPRPARSRPRSGPASRPRAARSRRSGRVVTAQLTERVEEIEDAKRRGETIWPVIDYADIEAGTVSPEAVEHLHRRGCVVIRGHFEREQALAWDQDIVDYVERNELLRGLPRPGRRLLRQRRLAPRDLPRVLVDARRWRRARATAWRASSRSSTTSGPTSPTACSGSTPTRTRSTPTASAAARPARTPAASAPTSTPARSTCG